MFAGLMGTFMQLQREVDGEALALLGKFADRAIASGDPKEFLKGVLRAVVDAPEDPQGRVQLVKVRLLPSGKKG